MRSSRRPRRGTPVAAESGQGEVTVLDPYHPLFGCTFPLLKVEGEEGSGQYCVVRMPGGRQRRIPIEATDRAAAPVEAYALPLSLIAVGRLLTAYERVSLESGGEGWADDTPHPSQSRESPRAARVRSVKARRTRPAADAGVRRAKSADGGDASREGSVDPPEALTTVDDRAGEDDRRLPLNKHQKIKLGEVQAYLGIGHRTMRRLLRDGRIKPVVDPLDNRRKLVSTQDLDHLKHETLASARGSRSRGNSS